MTILSSNEHCMRGIQKVLSLVNFRYTFVMLNDMGLIYELWLVFIINCMSTVCLLQEKDGLKIGGCSVWLILTKFAIMQW